MPKFNSAIIALILYFQLTLRELLLCYLVYSRLRAWAIGARRQGIPRSFVSRKLIYAEQLRRDI